MISIKEIITDKTPIYVTTQKEPRKRFFRKEMPRKIILKNFNHAEFIGEELASIRNIRCSHYFIVAVGYLEFDHLTTYDKIQNKSYEYKLGTINFEREGFQYKTINDYDMDLGNTNLEAMLRQTKNKENRQQLLEEMLEMIALDIYMGQTDRFSHNYLFEEDENHEIHLAPLFDFEFSLKKNYLSSPDEVMRGDLYRFKSIESCKDFIREYPIFRDILSSYLGVDLKAVIERAYQSRGLRMPEDKWQFFETFEENRKDVIRSIVR